MSLTTASPAEATPRPVRRREPRVRFAERDSAVLDAWDRGEITDAIAARFGVRPAMVLRIASKARHAGDPRAVRRCEPPDWQRFNAILDAFQQGGTNKGIVARLGVPLHVVDHAIRRGRAMGDPRVLARPRWARGGAAEQRNAILDAWQKGETTAAISRALNVTAEHVSYVVCKARRAGDPRAVRRKPGPQAKVPAP